jgi:hypothetical protein
VAFGWSFESQADADAHALERARRLAERLRMLRDRSQEELQSDASLAEWLSFAPPDVHDQIDEAGVFAWDYYGTSRPVREPILEHYGAPDAPWALITRNRYGARVLNAAGAMFVDMDLPPTPRDRRSLWQRWVLQVPPPAPPDPSDVLARARRVVEAHPGMGMRLYRTRGGFRGLITHQPYEPLSAEAEAVMEAFDTDPLYMTLCRAQRCFRARLTPKPWRIGMSAPPKNWFPYQEDPARKAVLEAWLQHYAERSHGRPACHVVEHLGHPDVHPEVAPVLDLHDRAALGEGELA